MAQRAATHQIRRPVAAAEATAGQTDLAQHGGQRDQRPERLLAVVRAAAATSPMLTMVRVAAISRASATMRSAGNAGDLFSPAASLGWPSCSPLR